MAQILFIIRARHEHHAAFIRWNTGIAPTESIIITDDEFHKAGGKLWECSSLRGMREDPKYKIVSEHHASAQVFAQIRKECAEHREKYATDKSPSVESLDTSSPPQPEG